MRISNASQYFGSKLLTRVSTRSRRLGEVFAGALILSGTPAAYAADILNATAVHPERGGLLIETEEQRQLPRKAPTGIPPVDPRLSIFVTDRNTMKEITFKEVMQQLVDQSGDRTLTPKQLFDTWWDSANKKVTPAITNGVDHCDDESAPDATTRLATLNHFPYRCPRPEGTQVKDDPFDPTSDTGFIAIAFSNRFDLADPGGRDCGEYRVVFARVSGADTGDPSAAGGDKHAGSAIQRNLIIFEARVPNPAPPVNLSVDPKKTDNAPNSMANLKGCKPIIDAWTDLSKPGLSTTDRGKRLHDLYLKGIPSENVGPIVSADNYRGDGHGQIRTNQFINHGADQNDASQNGQFLWTLREFKAARTATGPNGTSSLQIAPQTVKANPGSSLFDATKTDDRAAEFFDVVVGQIGPLTGGLGGEGNIDTFSYNNPDKFNSFESDESSDATVSAGGKLGSVFLQYKAQNGTLQTKIQKALVEHGSGLTSDQIVARLQTQTCAGCHRFSNKNLTAAPNPANDLGLGVNWTQSLGFTQESERDFEGGPDGNASRFLISDLLKDVFLPARLDNMRRFLAQ